MSTVIIGPHGGTVTVNGKRWSAQARSVRQAVDVSTAIHAGGRPYQGDYSVVPSAESQTIPTEGRTLAHDIIIAPIPSNYGLVTWNGSVLTVS